MNIAAISTRDYKYIQAIEALILCGERGFITHRGRDFIEISPNKGSLYKFRMYDGCWWVLYGTVKVAYCSDLHSCFKLMRQ